jgi:hypothetical protein
MTLGIAIRAADRRPRYSRRPAQAPSKAGEDRTAVMAYAVIITDPAEADLLAIYTYIEERAGTAIAQRFVDRIEQYCILLTRKV